MFLTAPHTYYPYLAYVILCLCIWSCANNHGDNDTQNTVYEKGQWISIKDTTVNSVYCLIDGHIYAGWIDSDEHNTSRSFFQASKKYFPYLINIDIVTFEINKNEDNEPYARDKNRVYYAELNIEFFDGETECGEIYF